MPQIFLAVAHPAAVAIPSHDQIQSALIPLIGINLTELQLLLMDPTFMDLMKIHQTNLEHLWMVS